MATTSALVTTRTFHGQRSVSLCGILLNAEGDAAQSEKATSPFVQGSTRALSASRALRPPGWARCRPARRGCNIGAFRFRNGILAPLGNSTNRLTNSPQLSTTYFVPTGKRRGRWNALFTWLPPVPSPN